MTAASSARRRRSSSVGQQDDFSPHVPDILIKAVFMALGVGILLPWNAFISAANYMKARLCKDDGEVMHDIEQWFGVIYNLSCVLSLGTIIVFQWMQDNRISQQETPTLADTNSACSPTRKRSSARVSFMRSLMHQSTSNLHQHPIVAKSLSVSHCASLPASTEHSFWLVVLPLVLYLLVFVAMTVLVILPDVPSTFFLVLSLTGLFSCGVCQSLASAGVVGCAGMFGADVGIGPYFNGQALGGVAVALANFAAEAMGDSNGYQEHYCSSTPVQDNVRNVRQHTQCLPYTRTDWATFGYFFSGCVVLWFCLYGFSYIEKYRLQRMERRISYEPLLDISEEELEAMADGEKTTDNSCGCHDPVTGLPRPCSEQEAKFITENDCQNETTNVWKGVRGPAVSIFIIYFVTLAIFPGWTSELRSVHQCKTSSRLKNDLYTPWTFVVFNTGDLLGRVLSSRVPEGWVNSNNLLSLSWSRFIYCPLFVLCKSRQASRYPTVNSDLYSFLVQFSFALLNGILTSLAFMHAPTLIPSSQVSAQAKGSEILNFALCLGLLFGASVSFPFELFAYGYW